MKKIIVEEPAFEKVEVGTRPVEKWQTSDGEIHNSEYDAERHEFKKCKLKERFVYIEEATNASIIEVENVEDLKRYVDDSSFEDVEKVFENIAFPNKLVIYSIADYDDDYYDTEKHYLTTIEEYKEILLKEIERQVN